jgi:type IV secretory pathway TraG/TraD family ATPase VirD4
MLDILTHGWNGLAIAWLLVAIPLWVSFAKGKAEIRQWVLSPVIALAILFGAGICVSILQGSLNAGTVMNAAIVLVCFPLAGYYGGRFLTRTIAGHDVHKRGSQLKQETDRQRASTQLNRPHTGLLTLAGVAVHPEDETKHFKLIGTTGTGKSTAIRELISGALNRGDRAIFADPDGGYRPKFYDASRGDVILNPFDRDSVKWDLFAEITNPYDVEQIANALIPTGEEGPGREWRGYARTFVTAIMRRCKQAGTQDLAELWRLLTAAPSQELLPIVIGTPAQPFLEPSNAKMFSNIRSVTGSALSALEYIPAQHATAFSVREWVRSGRGVLFVPYQAAQIAALRGLIAAWMRIAIFEAMSRPEGDQRLWFVVDELDALGNIDGLKDALARLRKFGGRCVLGFQSIAQVSSTYGAGEAHTIVENCANSLILRCSASEGGGTSRFASQLIGDREIVRAEVSYGRSHPSFLSRGGSSVSHSVTHRHVTEAAVMASQIEQLPDLAGFLKLASNPAWVRVALTPRP